MSIHRPFARTILAALATGLLMAACDVTNPVDDVNLRMNVTNAPVEFGAGAGRIFISGGQTTSSTSMVANQLDITSVEEIQRIQIRPAHFGYTPAPGKDGAAMGSGTVELFLFLGGVPVPGSPIIVTITNDVVTAVSPNSIIIDQVTVNRTLIEAVLNSLPPSQRPNLNDWADMTIDEVIAEINSTLASFSFPLVLVAVTTGDITGELKLNSFELDAEVVL